MTNKEAIEILKSKMDGSVDTSYFWCEAIRLAIQALEKTDCRCKDCKRRGTYDCPVYVGGDGMYSEPDDWFCADGERK